MNPYNFVPLDRTNPPARRRPIWHNTLTAIDPHTAKLYSGHLMLYIRAETPLFIRDADSPTNDPRHPGEHMRDRRTGYQIIPGTSIKGLLRSVVETLCSGCLTTLSKGEYYERLVPDSFKRCRDNTNLCVACRLFGMMGEGKNASVFLGKINIEDATVYEDTLDFYDAIYTVVLSTPKPDHRSFYLDQQGSIAGRKFYYHHYQKPRIEDRLIEIPNKKGSYRNQYIRPLAKNTEFSGRIDFTNLAGDEFAALLFAITLQNDMRHKIGYGKPMGLGSILMAVTKLHLVDYAQRYTTFSSHRGVSTYSIDDITDLTAEQMASFDDKQVHADWLKFSAQPSLQRLRDIWAWPPDSSVIYCYPSQRWFKEHPQARIADTVNLYPGN